MTLFSSLYGERLNRELANADTTILFTTVRRQQAINEGLREFADLTECFQRTSTVTILSGQAEYDLNAIAADDFARWSDEQVQYVYTDSNGDVQRLAGDDLPRKDVPYLNRYEPGWPDSTVASTLTQFPTSYYLRADGGHLYLGFTPTPSLVSSAAAEAIVPYVAIPAVLTSDTQEPFTVDGFTRTDLRPYHQAAVHYAGSQLEKYRRDDQASDRQLQRFLGFVQRYAQKTRKKGGMVITTAKNYFRRTRDVGVDPRV